MPTSLNLSGYFTGSGSPPVTAIILAMLHLLLGIGGLYGGSMLLIDPTGELIGFSPDILERIGVIDSFLLPGLFLIIVMGITPLEIVVALIVRKRWELMTNLNPLKHYHWAWTASLILGIILVLWLSVQFWLIGLQHPIQAITGFIGISIIVLSLLPNVRTAYRLSA